VAKRPARDYLCRMTVFRLLLLGPVCAAVLCAPPSLAAKKPKAKPAPTATSAVPTADPGPAKPLGGAGSWSAYMAQNKSGKVCYVVGQPEKIDPASVNVKSVMAMVTHRTEDKVSNVVSFDTNVPLSEDDDVALDVGGDKFALFAKSDTAWARTSDLDRTIVAALAKEKQAVVSATSKKGHVTSDTYSLAGFSKALALIDKACDVSR
jgi:invasion associated locus B (IalB) protein